ncbi:hypothetical protein DF268_34340 [Streptomyces sp. V2]|uniref:FXSXX-COOH protein n=1 Tax=Streptomyces niveiscabiei TaxID=164115 RepID=A0ABW9HUH6_9ACTN|nr:MULTISPECIES: hypothetical protein [Streptomyces]MDX3385054.1 hypothetical protein [Streptomyces niveiscabiei]PWG09064.1 hypothetical protein DF268_34340 [Streptomyces sp. V2]QZZ27132.1 hypothetical protein A7X85_13440 [Streptomyces sp. ST1015]
MKSTENGREGRRERGELAELAGAVPADRLSGLARSPIVEALLRRTRSGPQTPPGWHSAV